MREEVASVQHDIWSHWMYYLYSCCEQTMDGGYKIPKDKVKHWARQMSLKYDKLTESEKDSDRDQADKVLKIIKEKL